MEGLLSSWGMIIVLVGLFALMYFVMIRPRQKQQRQHEEMNKELGVGDRVITTAGIYGQIESLAEETVLLKLESGATMRVARASVLGKQGGTGSGRESF